MAIKKDQDFHIKIIVDTGNSNAEVNDLNKNLSKLEKTSEQASGQVKLSTGSMLNIAAAVQLAKEAYALFNQVYSATIQEFIDSQTEMVKLNQALQLMGDYSQATSEQFLNWADSIEAVTTADGGLLVQLATKAKLMGFTNEQAKNLVETSVDLAAVTGESVDQAFNGLNGTLRGNSKSVGALGILISNLTKEQLQAGEGVKRLGEIFRGQGAAALDTFSGKLEHSKNMMKGLATEIGEILFQSLDLEGGLDSSISTITKMTDFLQQNKEEFIIWGKVLYSFVESIGNIADGILKVVSAIVMGTFGMIMKMVQGVSFGLNKIGVVSDESYEKIKATADIALKSGVNLNREATQSFKQAFVGYKETNNEIKKTPKILEAAGKAFKGIKFGDKENIKEIQKEVEGIIKDLSGKIVALQNSINLIGANELQQINERYRASLDDLKITEDRLALLGQLSGKQLELINQAKELLLIQKNKELIDIQKKNYDDISEQNKALANDLAKQGMSQIEILEMQRVEQLRLLDVKTAHLALDEKGIAALELQKKLINEQASQKNSNVPLADMLMCDVGSAFSSVAMINSADSFVKAAKSGFTSIAVSFSKITVGSIVNGLKTVFEFGASVVTDAISGNYLDYVASFLETIENLPESIMGFLDRIDVVIDKFLSKFPQMIEKLMDKVPKILTKLMDALPKMVKMITDVMPQMAETFAKEFPKFIGVIMDILPELIGKMMDVLPLILDGLFDAVIKIIDGIPAIIDTILEKLPAVLDKLFDRIPDLIKSIFKAIPKIIVSILDNLPDILESLISGIIGAIGEIVVAFIDEFLLKGGLEKIIGGILRAIPRIVVALVRGIVSGLTKFFNSVGNLFSGKKMKLPKSISELPEKIAEGANKLGKDIAKGTSQLFSVKNLQEAVKGGKISTVATVAKEKASQVLGIDTEKIDKWWSTMWAKLTDWVTKIFKPIIEAFKTVFNFIIEAFKAVWNMIKFIFNVIIIALKAVWKFIQDIFNVIIEAFKFVWTMIQNIFNVIIGAFTSLWASIQTIFASITEAFTMLWANVKLVFDGIILAIQNVFNGIILAFQTIWQAIKDIFNGIITAFQTLWESIKNIFSSIINAISSVFSNLKENIFDPIVKSLSGAFDGIKTFFTTIKEKIFDPILGAFSKIFDSIKPIFKALSDAFNGIKGVFENLTGALKGFGGLGGSGGGSGGGALSKLDPRNWSTGGLVYASEGKYIDFKPKGTDTIPAMLTQGEYVVNRNAVQSLGLRTMQSINNGVLPQGSSGTVVNVNLEINTTEAITENFVKSKLMPRLRDELKKASMDGQFVLSAKGVR